MQCAALCKNGRRCRGYGSLLFEGNNWLSLCHIHEEFYENPDKLLEFGLRHASIFQTVAQRNAMRHMFRMAHSIYGEEFSATAAALLRLHWNPALAPIPFDRTQRWERKDKLDYMYQLLLESKVLEPCRIYELWLRGLKRQTRVLFNSLVDGQATPFTQRIYFRELLGPYLQGAPYDDAFQGCLHMVDPAIGASATPRNRAPTREQSLAFWKFYMESAMAAMNNRDILSVPAEQEFWEEVAQHHPTSPLKDSTLQSYVLALLKATRTAERMRLRSAMDRIREDLMAAAWHPRRVAAALEAGLEVEEL
jgi:hypothetical protein